MSNTPLGDDLRLKRPDDSAEFADSSFNDPFDTVDLSGLSPTQSDQALDLDSPLGSNQANPAAPARSDFERAGARYQIVGYLAEGGLGEVHHAQDLELHRDVVIKRIKRKFRDVPLFQRRLLREARITALLEHPGIVPVHGLCKNADGHFFYVMRKVNGMSMTHAIHVFHDAKPDDYRYSRNLRSLLQRFIQVCNTIEYAHTQNVIHRDIKPDNILFRRLGETLVIDWGLAKFFKGAAPLALANGSGPDHETRISERDAADWHDPESRKCGTRAYMSPEQLLGVLEKVGPLSDVFSLGATLYEILTGVAPTRLSNQAEGTFLLVDDGVTPARRLNPKVPRPLESICRKAMRHLPQERYPSAAEIGQDLEHWLADEEVSADKEPIIEMLARLVRRHQARFAAAFGVLVTAVVVLTGATALINQSREDAVTAERHASNSLRDMTTAKNETTRILLAAIQNMPELTDLSSTPEATSKRRRITEKNIETLESLRSISPDDINVKVNLASHWNELGFLAELEGDLKIAEDRFASSVKQWDSLIDSFPSAFYNKEITHSSIASLKLESGRPREAIPLYEAMIVRLEEDAGLPFPNEGRMPFVKAWLIKGLPRLMARRESSKNHSRPRTMPTRSGRR